MIRWTCIALVLCVLCSPSRGDDAERARRVRVALALSCGCAEHCKPKVQPASAKPRLDWLVVPIKAAVEVAPAPKVAKEKAEPAKPTPAPEAKPMPGVTMIPVPYVEVIKRVRTGESIVMLVKPTDAEMTAIPVRIGFTTLRCDDAPLGAGRYDCYMKDGQPVMDDKRPPPISLAPAVVAEQCVGTT